MVAYSRSTNSRHRFYHDIQLRGPIPQRVLHHPSTARRPSETLIRATLEKRSSAEEWATGEESWRSFERFDWLPACAAAECKEGDDAAQALMKAWFQSSGHYSPQRWSRRLTAARLSSMLRHLSVLGRGQDAPWREAILDTIARQGRHLKRMEQRRGDSDPSFLDICVVRSLVSLCLPEDKGIGAPTSHILEKCLQHVVSGNLPLDWRDPQAALDSLSNLQALASAYATRRLSPPPTLGEAITVLRLFVGGLLDSPGRFAALPGCTQRDAGILASMELPRRKEAERVLSPMGIHRLSEADSTLHIDAGHPDAGDFGAGGFSLSNAGERVVISCGAPSQFAVSLFPNLSKWRESLLAPAAASTLDSLWDAPSVAESITDAEGSLIHLQRRNGSERHDRRMWLSTGGNDIRGEDVVRSAASPVYRFHFPAGTHAVEGETDSEATVTLKSGKSWRFKTNHARFRIEESVDATSDGSIDASQQLVLFPENDGVRWAIHRL